LQRRHTPIQEEITKLYQEDPISKPKIQFLKQLLRTEVIREIYKKLKFKVTRITTQQHSIQILNNDNTIDTIVDHQEISRHIAEYNTQHFQQASKTPLSQMSYKNIVKKYSEPTWIKKNRSKNQSIRNKNDYS
jgi:hypothetical protein